MLNSDPFRTRNLGGGTRMSTGVHLILTLNGGLPVLYHIPTDWNVNVEDVGPSPDPTVCTWTFGGIVPEKQCGACPLKSLRHQANGKDFGRALLMVTLPPPHYTCTSYKRLSRRSKSIVGVLCKLIHAHCVNAWCQFLLLPSPAPGSA